MTHSLTQREVLDIVTSIGYYILKNGGEISRAEDTVERIGLAYGMDAVHVFAIAASIVVSVEKGHDSLSQTRRVRFPQTNLDKIEKFNALSRKICETLPSYEEIVYQIREIKKSPTFPEAVMVFAYALIGGAFSVFFGGGVLEFLFGFIIGSILKLVLNVTQYLKSPPFFKNVAGASLTVFLTQLCTLFVPSLNAEIINIGVLMNLVPGVLLTNCIRDFISSDYTAGMSKIGEVLFIAIAIALGVSVSVFWR